MGLILHIGQLVGILSRYHDTVVDFLIVGNGWAAAGMLRVAATMAQSQFSKDLRGQQDDLASWVHEIQAGMYAHFDASTGLFTNVADNSASFRDAASSALLAHSVYRLAHVKGWYDFIPQAEITRSAIARSNINAQGWLQPVVDPHSVSKEGEESPEGQAFVLLMQAAWKDWRVDGAKGVKNAAAERSVGVSGTIMMMVWGAFFVCIL